MPALSRSGLLFDLATPIEDGFAATRYVPILLDRRGERRALGELAARAWDNLTPYVQITPPELRDGPEQGTSPLSWVAALASVVGERVIYLDPVGLRRRSSATRPIGASTAGLLFGGARDAGIRYVPVYPIGMSAVAGQVARAAADQGLGLAIRYRIVDAAATGGRSLADVLRSEADMLGGSAESMDLIIDLGYLHPDFSLDADQIVRVLHQLMAVATWRTVTFAGSSVPPSLSDEVPDGQFKGILRREWALWRSLFRAYPGLRYGDYAIQNPIPPDPVNTQFMRASIRYTSGDWMLAVRGDRALRQMRPEEQAAEYQHLAELLFLHPDFKECCAGDRFIVDCSDRRVEVRTQQAWRYVGTLHHLTTVVAQLSALTALPAAAAVLGPTAQRPRPESVRRTARRSGATAGRSGRDKAVSARPASRPDQGS
jgi:hypothetical protein